MKAFLLSFLLLLTIATNAQTNLPNYVPTNGLVGWWPFNGNANDESGNGNNGTVNGANLTTDRFGNFNNAFSFTRNMVNHVDVSNSVTLNNLSNISISIWVKLNSYNEIGQSGYNHYINKSDQNNYHHFVFANNSTHLYFYFGNGSNYFATNNLPTLNQWNNLTVTYNYDSTSTSYCKFYINGTIVDSISTSQGLNMTLDDVRIGSFGNNSYGRVDGSLDDIGIWNRALSPSEIQQLYTTQVPCTLTNNFFATDTITACGNSITLNAQNAGATYSWSTNETTQTINANVSGWYKCTVSQGAACSVTDSIYVSLPNALPASLQTGLVGYWPFCGNANDESGNGNNGITMNGVALTTDRYGNTNSAYSFDGVNDKIVVLNSSHPIGNINISYSCWIKPDSLSAVNASAILCIGSITTPNGTSAIFLRKNFIYYTQAFNDAIHTFSLPNHVWNNLIMVRKTNNSTLLYINGVFIDSVSVNPTQNVTNSNIVIGSNGNDLHLNGEYFSGTLDDIGIWNRALTQQEITNLYNAQNPCANIVSNFFTLDTLAVCGTSTTLSAPANYSYAWSTNDTTQTISVTQSGWYKCAVTNSMGCSAMDSVFVSLVNANIQQNDTTICAGSTVQLSVGNTISNTSLPTNLQNGLVGYWPFNGNANDESGNGNNGTVNGATLTTDRFGNAGAYLFANTPDNILINNLHQTNISSYSISGWFKIDPTQFGLGGGTILAGNIPLSTPAGLRFSLGGVHNSQWQVEDGLNTNGILGSDPNGSYNNNQWHHFACTFSSGIGLIDSSAFKIYMDGQLIPSISFQQNWPPGSGFSMGFNVYAPVNNGSLPIVIGNHNGFMDNFKGALDEISIYNRALSAAEVAQMYEIGNPDVITYLWSTGDTTASINVNPAQTTTYYCTVSNGISTCTDSVMITVNNPTVNAGNDQSVCAGNPITLNAISVDSISWSNNGSNNQTIVPTATASYIATATNSIGCSASDTVIVTVNPLPNINAGNDQTICSGNSIVLNASANATISWNNNVVNNQSFVPAQSGAYVATAISLTNCTSTDTVMVTVNPLPNINAGNDVTLCAGAALTLNATSNAPISWSNNGSNNQTFVPTVTTSYIATATNSIGCSASDTVIVNVNPLPTPQISHTYKAICPGGDTKVIVTGGTNYLWNDGQTTDTATFTQAGNYKAIVTNAYGCVDSTASVQIQVKNIPTILIAAPTLTACAGEQVQLSLYPGTNITGFDIQWNVNAAPIVGATTTQYQVIESGKYSLSVSGGANCTNTSAGKTILIKPAPTASYTTSGTTNLCTGGKVTLTANMLPVYTNVNWLRDGTVVTNSPNYKANVAGNYQLVVNQNGCRDTSAIVSVTINPKPVVSISTLTPTICSGNTTMLTTQANTTGLTYQWLLNQSPIAGATDAVYATTIGGIYRVIASNVGCTSLTNNQKITVNATPAPTITPQSSTTIGVNGSVKLTATYIANATYQWYLNNTPIAGATKRDYKAISGGDYTVEMSKLGCTGISAPITVNQTGVKEEAGVTSNPIATEDAQFEIKAYPNPVSNLLTINVSGVEEVNATIQVMDFSGKLVATKEMKTTSTTVDMTGYASGVYLIRYKDAEGRTGTIKITKE